MGSSLIIKNAQSQEFKITHNDNAGAINLNSNEIASTVSVKAEISTGSNLVTTPTGSIGYGVGSGGTVTQLTSKSTTVSLNKPTGQITTNNSALGANTGVAFSFNNSLLGVGDSILLSCNSVGYRVFADAIGVGGCTILLENRTAGSLSDAIVINYQIVKGAIS